jgi:hypothetical protein
MGMRKIDRVTIANEIAVSNGINKFQFGSQCVNCNDSSVFSFAHRTGAGKTRRFPHKMMTTLDGVEQAY